MAEGDPNQHERDSADDQSSVEAEKDRLEAEKLRTEAEKLKNERAALQAQVDELKALSARATEPPKDLQRLHLLQIQPVRDILVILLVLGVFWLGYILRSITIPMLLALTLAYLVEPVVKRIVRGQWMTRTQAAASIILIIVVMLTVPLVVGTTLAVSQGLQQQAKVQRNITYVQALIQNPNDESAKRSLERSGGRAWMWLGKTIAGFANPQPTAEELAEQQNREKAEEESEPGTETDPEAQPPPVTPLTPGAGTPEDAELNPPSSVAPPPLVPPAPAVETEDAPREPLTARATKWAAGALEDNLQGLGRMVARYLVGTGANALEIGVKTVSIVVYLGFAAFLVLFFFFFFSSGYERVTTAAANLIPKWKRERTLNLLRQMDAVIAAFVRGRLIIMGILMVMFTIGFWLIGVPGPLIVGPITGILAVVPYLGLVSIPAAMLLMWLQPVGPEWQREWWWILVAPVALYFLIQTIEDYVLTPQIQGKATDMDVPTILFAVLAGGILAGFYGVLLAIPAAACLKILLREAFWPRFKAWGEGKVKDFLPISRYDPTETDSSR